LGANQVEVARELDVADVSRVPQALRESGAQLVLAAGGDGTVGAVADQIASSGNILGILPLGTSNDFARSLGIPMDIRRATRLIREGKVSDVDLGRIEIAGREPMHFVHAATAGVNVNFAKLATRASLRKRFGRLTYIVAATSSIREHTSFRCRLHYRGGSLHLKLSHLSVINAPVFGGFLGLRFSGSSPDDRLLDVLAVEDLPMHRVILAGLYQLLKLHRPLSGVHAIQTDELAVETDEPLDVTLDGEIRGRLPSRFTVAGEALRVITPHNFKDQ
jgi:YegS/Rv2252/BmrU family lipid kinase